VLPEVKLGDPLWPSRLRSRDRLRCIPVEGEEEKKEEEKTPKPARKRSNSLRETLATLLASARKRRATKSSEGEEDGPPLHGSSFNPLRGRVYAAPLSAFPNWLWEMYDSHLLADRVRRAVRRLKHLDQSAVSIPSDPEELSFWVACNLPVDDSHRLAVLAMDCAEQRLRYELGLLARFSALCCRRCGAEVAAQDDIFSMSQEGPQSAYVNPGGYVHETLTLYKTRRLYLVGETSTEYSWFPGYAWTIAQCKGCHCHMGWKFTSTHKRLTPKKFWGISRRNITHLQKVGRVERYPGEQGDEGDEEQEEAEMRSILVR